MNWKEKLQELKLTPRAGNRFSPVNEDDLNQIECKVGSRLPDDYRFFLSHYGASDFEEYGVFPTEGGGVAPGTFFGRDIAQVISALEERLPRLVIPINDDGAGNLILMSLRPDTYGAIYYQSHSVGVDSDVDDVDASKFGTMARLASDFSSFVSGLEAE